MGTIRRVGYRISQIVLKKKCLAMQINHVIEFMYMYMVQFDFHPYPRRIS